MTVSSGGSSWKASREVLTSEAMVPLVLNQMTVTIRAGVGVTGVNLTKVNTRRADAMRVDITRVDSTDDRETIYGLRVPAEGTDGC